MSQGSMDGETALVTGATSGIGKAIARQFLERGCSVAICSRSAERVASTVDEFKKEHGDRIIGYTCDVSEPDAVKVLVEKVVKAFGSIRILVANAGISLSYGPFEHVPFDELGKQARKVLGVNLVGTMLTVAAVLPIMIDQDYGRIVTLGGAGTTRPLPNTLVYSASKGGVVVFSRCLAEELKESHPNIKINVFQPGMVRTGLTTRTSVVPGWKDPGEVMKDVDLVLRYLGTPADEVAARVIPFVLPSCKSSGKMFRGYSMLRFIGNAIKLRRVMKRVSNERGG